MSKPTVRIHNTELDEVIDREMTDDEFVKYQEAQAYFAAEKAEKLANANAKAALLKKLGITQDEANLLLS